MLICPWPCLPFGPSGQKAFAARTADPCAQWSDINGLPGQLPRSSPRSVVSIRRCSPGSNSASKQTFGIFYVCTAGASCVVFSGILAGPCCCHLLWLDSQSLGVSPAIKSKSALRWILPSCPSLAWCNQLGLAEGGQPCQVKGPWAPLSCMSPGPKRLGVCFVAATALRLVGLQTDDRVLFWFCSHPVLLCTFMALHVGPVGKANSPEVSLDLFCFWEVCLFLLLFYCGFPV